MRVVLVTPPFDIIRKGYGSRIKIKRGYLPPLGIGYLAGVLEKGGHEVSLIDSAALNIDYPEIIARVKQIDPDLIGISTLTATAREAYEISKQLKQQTGKPIVMGGAHPTCFPQEVMTESKHTDIIVVGEGELVLPEIVACLENKGDLHEVKGIQFRDEDGEVHSNPPANIVEDLDSIPSPARHLYQNEVYIPLPNQSRRLPATSMITSRGCPWSKCKFCFQAGSYGQKYRRRSPENVVEEISWLYTDFGFREIAFWDDVFTVNTRWILKFCDLLEQKKLDISWSCYGRVDTVKEEMLVRMGQAGCFSIYYGFESGNQDILDRINKGTTLEQAENAVRWTRKAGIENRGTFMLALPGEDPEKGKRTANFAKELDLDSVGFAAFHPMIGTELYEIALKEGQPVEYPDKGAHQVTYVPDGYNSAQQIENLIRRAYRDFYLRPSYLLKNIKRIKSIKDINKYFEGFKLFLGIFTARH